MNLLVFLFCFLLSSFPVSQSSVSVDNVGPVEEQCFTPGFCGFDNDLDDDVEDVSDQVPSSLIVKNEKQHCEKIRNMLFNESDIEIARKARIQFQRFLPVYIKTQFAKYEGKGEMEFPHLTHDRFNLLGPVGPPCKTKLEKYGFGDEEKRVCGLQQLLRSSSLEKLEQSAEVDEDHECVILSIGSNNQWAFEEDIINKTSCRVETFDCTVAKNLKPPKALRSRVRLHHLCLSDRNYEVDDRRYVTWSNLLASIKLKKAPTLLKMDIEGYEFPVMKEIIDNGKFLPFQISMEIHYIRHENNVPVYDRRVSSIELYAFLQYLYTFGGYYLIDRHDNPHCRVCSEVVLAKLNCENYPLNDVISNDYKELLQQPDPKLKKTLKQSLKAQYYN
jgi:hypothetical protein